VIYSNGAAYSGMMNAKGECNGLGIYKYPDGHRFIGYFKENIRYANGITLIACGDIKYGRCFNNIYDGPHEIYLSSSSSSIFVGHFSKGVKYGNASSYFSNGAKLVQGKYQNNKLNGFAIYHFSDGRIYHGYLKDNKRDGKGIMFWPNGDCYDGSFQDGKMNGFGQLSKSDGSKVVGIFKDDELDVQLD
jgi:hypothetical protein